VEEVTVIGIPDDYRGEAPKAFIKLRNGHTATVDDIQRHLKVKLAKIELPAAIEFRDSLPKTMIGKLSKKELKAQEAQNRAGLASTTVRRSAVQGGVFPSSQTCEPLSRCPLARPSDHAGLFERRGDERTEERVGFERP
jgi:hypothetical protein